MTKICQSCGMHMRRSDDFGTNLDGTTNQEYCTYCYQNGEFIEDCTMEEMIDNNLKFFDEFKDIKIEFTKEEAKEKMQNVVAYLKRWN